MLHLIGDYFLQGQLFEPPRPPTYSTNDTKLSAVGARLTYSDSPEHLPLLEVGSYRSKPRTLILYLHANGTDLGGFAAMAAGWADDMQAYLIAPEYPGYGVRGNETATVKGVSRTARQALAYALSLLDNMSARHPDARLVVVGRSLGTGPATEVVAASNDPRIAALVLISPYESIQKLVERYTGFSGAWTVSDFWPTVRNIKQVRAPILLVHGDADRVIPVEHSRTLAAQIAERNDARLVVVPGGTHVDKVFDWPEHLRDLLGW